MTQPRNSIYNHLRLGYAAKSAYNIRCPLEYRLEIFGGKWIPVLWCYSVWLWHVECTAGKIYCRKSSTAFPADSRNWPGHCSNHPARIHYRPAAGRLRHYHAGTDCQPVTPTLAIYPPQIRCLQMVTRASFHVNRRSAMSRFDMSDRLFAQVIPLLPASFSKSPAHTPPLTLCRSLRLVSL